MGNSQYRSIWRCGVKSFSRPILPLLCGGFLEFRCVGGGVSELLKKLTMALRALYSQLPDDDDDENENQKENQPV